MIIWHYAVWKGRFPYMWPACLPTYMNIPDPPKDHGITIVRGDVNCTDCKRMMGMV